MRGRCVLALLLVVFAVGGLPSSAAGTILRPFDLAGLSREAHAIVRGQVVGQEARREAESGRIYTYSTVEVLEVVKGEPALRQVTVKQLGGTVGEWAVTVAGTADLQVGEEVVLFLRTDAQFGYLVGMHQGKFGVRRDEKGAWVTREPLRAARGEPADLPVAPAVQGERPALDGWLATVRRHVAEAAVPGAPAEPGTVRP